MPSVFIYFDSTAKSLDAGGVTDYLSGLGLRAEFRGDFLSFLSAGPERVREFEALVSKARVLDIEEPVDWLRESRPNYPSETFGRDLYDGFWVQRIFARFFLESFPEALAENEFHAVVTGRLLGTFGTRRYHARTVISGFPSFVSTSGIVEGPARPREYYFLKAEFARAGRRVAELDGVFGNRFLSRDDERMTAVAAAYVLQPLMHHFTGKEFCEDSACSLFNSHWQKDVLAIQLKGEVCGECRGEIEKFWAVNSF